MEHLEQYMDDANLENLGAEESTTEETETMPEEGQPGTELETAKENEVESGGEKSLEDQLNELKTSDETPTELLDQINQLGLLRKGLPVEFQNVDEIKEALSKGFDYTQKTQELADERAKWDADLKAQTEQFDARVGELDKRESELNNVILENSVMDRVLDEIESNEPELFELLQSSFQRNLKQYQSNLNNPAFSAMKDEVNTLRQTIEELKGGNEQAQHNDIKKEWETGLSDLQASLAPKLKTLGVKPDWQKVKDHWAADASGKVDVKSAFYATHGEALSKALESQKKLAETKAKSNSRLGTDSVTQKEETRTEAITGSRNYMSYLEKLADSVTS